MRTIVILALCLTLAGCQRAVQHESHDPAELFQKGGGMTQTTVTEEDFGAPEESATPTTVAVPVLKARTTTSTTTTVPPVLHVRGPTVGKHTEALTGLALRGSTPGDVIAKVPALTVTDNLPGGKLSTSDGQSAVSSEDVSGKTTFAEGKGAGLWASIGNFFHTVWTWIWVILIVFVGLNLVLLGLLFVPPAAPIAGAILAFEGQLIPYVGAVLLWLKARLVTETLAKTVANVDAAATAGTVKAPFFQAQSAALNADEKALVDALRPANATNILEAGVVAPTAPAAVQPGKEA